MTILLNVCIDDQAETYNLPGFATDEKEKKNWEMVNKRLFILFLIGFIEKIKTYRPIISFFALLNFQYSYLYSNIFAFNCTVFLARTCNRNIWGSNKKHIYYEVSQIWIHVRIQLFIYNFIWVTLYLLRRELKRKDKQIKQGVSGIE